jgi:hypothetical protein
MKPNRDEIEHFLSQMYGGFGGVIELAWSPADQDAIICADHYSHDKLDKFVEHAVELNADRANIYFTPAVLRADTVGRAHDDDVAEVRFLWTDLDSAEAMDAPAKRYTVCEPTASVLTRASPDQRMHCYWLLDQPLAGGAEARRLNRRVTAHMFGDMSCTNPARVLRLPGTVRWPTEEKPIGPHHLEPWFYGESLNVYTAEEIEAAFPVVKEARGRRDYGLVSGSGTDWDTFLAQPIKEGERNGKLFRLTGKLLSKNLSPHLVAEIVQAVNAYHCTPELDEDEVDVLVDSCCAVARRKVAG